MYNTIYGPITSLAQATGGRFALGIEYLETLFSHTGFTELRLRCFKPWHGRTAHFVVSGDYLAKALFQSIVTHGSCDPVRFLADDNSVFGSVTCDRYKLGFNNQNVGLYYLFICDSHHNFGFQLALNSFECDDRVTQAGSSQAGTWQYYVR